MDELPDQALAARDVGVGLDPHAALGDKLALFDGLQDSLIEFGIVGLDHPVQVRLTLQELEFGILLHQGQLAGKGAHALALRLGQGPQPGHVDVGVAKGVHGRRR